MSEPLRVLLVAPWFRSLATVWAQGLRDRGHRAMVVTTPLHFDPAPVADDDLVLSAPWRSPAGVRELREAQRAVRAFAPDVVVTEVGRDPRFLALALLPRVPLVLTTHDAVPHDRAHRLPPMRELSRRALTRRAAADAVFSRHVADALPPSPRPRFVLPLTSEMPPEHVPEPAPAGERRDVLVVGRLSAYKNLDLVLRAWEQHRRSPAYRGDRLVVIGDGDPGVRLPADVEWVRERFRFADVAPRLARAKASLALYSAGSQSGVQVISMQCGAPVVASTAGGLPEYLPPGERPVAPDDLPAAVAALDRLADPTVAAEAGRRHREWYDRRLSPARAAEAWEEHLLRLLDRRPAPSPSEGS